MSISDVQTIEKGNSSLLLPDWILTFLLSVIIEKSKGENLEVQIFSFLSCNSEGYIFLNTLSKFRCSFLGHKLSLKSKVLLKTRTLLKSLY